MNLFNHQTKQYPRWTFVGKGSAGQGISWLSKCSKWCVMQGIVSSPRNKTIKSKIIHDHSVHQYGLPFEWICSIIKRNNIQDELLLEKVPQARAYLGCPSVLSDVLCKVLSPPQEIKNNQIQDHSQSFSIQKALRIWMYIFDQTSNKTVSKMNFCWQRFHRPGHILVVRVF